MITVDLGRFSSLLVRPLEASDVERLLSCVEGSVHVRLRALREACAAAKRRIPHRTLGMASADTRVQIANGKLHIDVDVELPMDAECARRPG